MDEQQIGQAIGPLNEEYDQLYAEVEELYQERSQVLGDPGAYYDLSYMINAKEERIERITDELARLHRLRQQYRQRGGSIDFVQRQGAS